MDAETNPTYYTVEGPYARKGYRYATRKAARRAADRMDTRYGAYRHFIRTHDGRLTL